MIVDYGMGNLRNVRRAFDQLTHDVLVTDDIKIIASADKLVLPGVGAFGEAVKRIDSLGFRKPLVKHVEDNRPLLGICLGMQLLFERSEESPGTLGLGLLKGEIKKFGGGVKVPHIGWNDVVPAGSSVLLGTNGSSACFYFVHSYYLPDSPATVATSTYGVRFSSAVQWENIFGVQFHPEKSQTAGAQLIRHFVEL